MDIVDTNRYRCTMRGNHEHRVPKDYALGTLVRRARVRRGETQEDVARRAGLTVAAYARIERGTADPRWTTVRSIAEALEISLTRLEARPRARDL
jgi:transcriptional regulator with XRE-family HTH domain